MTEYEAFIADDVTLYVDKKVLEQYVEENKLHINIEGYGTYIMEMLNEN